jgi:hypothetical protein
LTDRLPVEYSTGIGSDIRPGFSRGRSEEVPAMAKIAAVPVAKSERLRRLLRETNPETGQPWTLADAARKIGMNYAFAYGVAQRSGQVATAAARRPSAGSKFVPVFRWIGYSERTAVRLAALYAAGDRFPRKEAGSAAPTA